MVDSTADARSMAVELGRRMERRKAPWTATQMDEPLDIGSSLARQSDRARGFVTASPRARPTASLSGPEI
jgi:hypothetical protein